MKYCVDSDWREVGQFETIFMSSCFPRSNFLLSLNFFRQLLQNMLQKLSSFLLLSVSFGFLGLASTTTTSITLLRLREYMKCPFLLKFSRSPSFLVFLFVAKSQSYLTSLFTLLCSVAYCPFSALQWFFLQNYSSFLPNSILLSRFAPLTSLFLASDYQIGQKASVGKIVAVCDLLQLPRIILFSLFARVTVQVWLTWVVQGYCPLCPCC